MFQRLNSLLILQTLVQTTGSMLVILKDKEAQLNFLAQTNDNKVMTRPIWELMNRLPMFEKCENDGLKNTIWFADRVVNIPSSVRTSDLPKE